MRKMIWAVAAACMFGCAEIDEDSTVDSDTLTVIPIGPGTDPRIVAPPDTPQSQPENRDTPGDSAARR